MECARLGINFCNILQAFDWKVSEYLILPDLVQQLGQAKQDSLF